MAKKDLYDPLFSKTKRHEATASHVEEAATGFVHATVGGVNGPKIPVMVDVKDRLCVPVPEK